MAPITLTLPAIAGKFDLELRRSPSRRITRGIQE